MWPFKNTPAQPKEASETEECDGLAEVNMYHDEERKFRRAGDKTAARIMDHHRQEAVRQFMDDHNCVVTYDSKADRYCIWRGEWR